ncbi:peptidoglycan/LPS O-acetylase OafA/YrhL [Paraburkholderia sp. GAS333]|uniref:acyltransferase family protein n=1 Tax=Paraburkholderia sp. GAS333 TaxID=3156279 RepID=UPI003D1F8DBC
MENTGARSNSASTGEIRPMTGVRGIAALSVVALHYLDNADAAIRPWRHAYLAVDLFFMLSGMVLALTYASTATLQAGRRPYINFIQKRIARIFPLYLAVTLVQTAFDLSRHIARGIPLPSTLEPTAMVANLFLVQSWGISNSIVQPAWSLSVELAVYLAFPVLVALTIRSRPAIAWAMAGLSVVLLLTVSIGSRNCGIVCNGFLDVITGNTPYPLMRCAAGFTFGLLAYRLFSLPKVRAMVTTNLFALLSVIGALAAFSVGLHDLVVYLLLFATVLACFGNSRAANVMFGNRMFFSSARFPFDLSRSLSALCPRATDSGIFRRTLLAVWQALFRRLRHSLP